MAGKNNDDHARALEALSAGGSEPKEVHPEQPAAEPAVRSPSRPAAPEGMAAASAPEPASPARPAMRASGPASTDKQVHTKRTIIPLLLTMGTLMPLAGLASILMGEDSLIGEELTLPLALIVLGLLILGAGVLTMLQVKSALSQRAR